MLPARVSLCWGSAWRVEWTWDEAVVELPPHPDREEATCTRMTGLADRRTAGTDGRLGLAYQLAGPGRNAEGGPPTSTHALPAIEANPQAGGTVHPNTGARPAGGGPPMAGHGCQSAQRPYKPELLQRQHSDMEALKTEILLSTVIKSELKNALAEDLGFLKSELQAVKNKIQSYTTALHGEVDQVRAEVKEAQDGLSTWSDEVTSLQSTVTDLKKELVELREKVRGYGRTLKKRVGQEKHGRLRPRVIIAKLHYHQECVEILCRARSCAPLRFNGEPVTIFPDYTVSIARARAAFTEIRGLLRGHEGVHYGLLFPARLRITHGGEDKEFTDPGKAMDYVKKIIPTSDEGK
ncbi:hypothetical protein L3Q82_011490 [Scortum barcoo]|uniref:Uncharacterized protein n=1 Tax=Scortum barcoo TaxID=214431 RepID=A0ACB8WBR5_9TELE|nr:hypothetical protein L3Q82_011490 [Scortum barcoo]